MYPTTQGCGFDDLSYPDGFNLHCSEISNLVHTYAGKVYLNMCKPAHRSMKLKLTV